MTSLNGTYHHDDVLLLAERMRVEERLLMAAFSAVGRSARILKPGDLGLTVGSKVLTGTTVVCRLPAGRQAATLALLLDDAGATVVNEPSLVARLEDRARLLHWLSDTGFTTLPTMIGFSEQQVLAASDAIGYPIALSPLDAGQPSLVVDDRESAEAVIEHRVVLGGERALIVRPAVSNVELRRVVVAGRATFAARAVGDWPIKDETGWEPVNVTDSDLELADGLREMLGVGIYHADCIAGAPRTVLKVRPLNSFRAFHDAGYDVAGAIVEHVLGVGLEVASV